MGGQLMLGLESFLEPISRMTVSIPGLQQLTENSNVFLTAFLTLALLVLGMFLFEAIQRKNLPPGPFAWPIVGNLFSLGRYPYKTLREFALKNGELLYLRMGSIPCIVVNSAAMAKEVVTKHDLQFAHRPTKLFSYILLNHKDIIANSYGPSWRHLRMICTSQFFTKKRLSSYEVGRTQEIHTLIKFILEKSRSEDRVVNVPFQLKNTATNIISRMVFNKRLFVEGEGCNAKDAERYQEILKMHFTSYAIFVISDYIPCLSFITRLQGTRERMQNIADTIHKKLDEILDLEGREQRRKNLNEEEEANCEKDFVDLLLETPSHDGVGTLDHVTIRAVVLDMLFAGAETQSSTIEWVMAYLLRHRDVMQRAQAEVDNVVGSERVVQETDLEHLPYLDAVVKEVMRVQPSAPIGVNHESREECRVAGYNLPARTRLIFNIHAIHRDPSVYDRPKEFDPSRFLNASSEGLQYQLMPFGAGRRICPGMPLANINMTHILAHLLHSFDWDLPDGEELDLVERFDGITAPKLRPLMTIAKPRKPALLY
ncbi:hypothetical protein M758_9G025200 [Ceratodon purpureus]|nr:hypothetical protein M758_9G025200 [Ceratodon purpureus]